MKNMNIEEIQKLINKNEIPESNIYNYSISNLINSFKEGMLALPPFQRLYVWDKRRASELISSALHNVPMSTIYMYADNDHLFIIDGQQRILTFVMFFLGKWLNEKGLKELRLAMEFQLCDSENKSKIIDQIFHDENNYDEFTLDLDESHYLYNLKYTDLNDSLRIRLKYGSPISCYTFKTTKKEAVELIEKVFNLVNTSGVPLSVEEVNKLLEVTKR